MDESNVLPNGQLFKNRFYDKITRTHIAVPLTIFYGAGMFILFYEIIIKPLPHGFIVIAFFAGLFSFTLFEYLFHRFVFHMPTNTPRREKIQFSIHGAHHQNPRDKLRLAMPPYFSVVLATIVLSFFYLLQKNYGLSFGGGFLTGYAAYLTIHYSIHTIIPPKNFLRYLWIHHSYHHYKSMKMAFGVSSPLWDYVFGTKPVYSR